MCQADSGLFFFYYYYFYFTFRKKQTKNLIEFVKTKALIGHVAMFKHNEPYSSAVFIFTVAIITALMLWKIQSSANQSIIQTPFPIMIRQLTN